VQLFLQPGEVARPLHLLVQAVPGPDLDPAVTAGIGHEQLLVRAALMRRRGELEALAVHAVAAGPGLARAQPPVIEDPVAGDGDQQLDLQAAQGMRESGRRVPLVQDEQRRGPPGLALPPSRSRIWPAVAVTGQAPSGRRRTSTGRVHEELPHSRPITHWNSQPGTTLRSPSHRHGA
jgi:hypothetical protein